MQTSLVMTIISPDRPGLVGQLSAVIADHGGNWLESRMAHLGGQFAGILRIQVSDVQEPKLLAALQALEPQGLSIRVQPDSAPVTPVEPPLGTVEVMGHDRPGIVRQIAQVFAQQQINVEELITTCESAPMSGEKLFRAIAHVRLPEGGGLGRLQLALEQIASDLMVDIHLTPGKR